MQGDNGIYSCCIKCRWWNEHKHSGFGECRRYPPKENHNVGYQMNMKNFEFPTTNGADWCGEFNES